MTRNDQQLHDAEHRLGLRELEIFLAFAQTQHMGRAAEEIGVSIPSIQRTVRALELELGVPLVERDGRRLRLLHAGQVLAEHATQILRSRTDAVRATLAASGSERLTLRLGHTSSLGFVIVPRYVEKVLRRDPETHVQLRQGSTAVLLAAILTGGLDAALVSGPVDAPELHVVPLFEDPVLLAVPIDDPLAHAARVDIAAFRDRGFITLGESSGNHAGVLRLCARAGFRPRIVLEADDLCTVEGAVAAGLGVALVPRSMNQHPHPDVAHVPIATAIPMMRPVMLVYPRGAPRNEALASLLAVVSPRSPRSA
jgi:DNA-binding transcriptional LysR family regulator